MATLAEMRGKLPGYFTRDDVAALDPNHIYTIKFCGDSPEPIGNPSGGSRPEYKPVILFEEIKKGVVLNKSRLDQLSALAGGDDKDPVGLKVRLTVGRPGGKGMDQVIINGVDSE